MKRALSMIAILTVFGSPSIAASEEHPLLIRADRLIDGMSDQPIEGALILVEGDKISAVGANVRPPANAEVLDLSGYTVLPGLIDSHTHICLAPDYSSNNPVLNKSVAFRTLEGAAAAWAALEAGFTTLRDVDNEGAGFADVAIRDAINQNLIPGPRLLVSTLALSITGGHMNHTGLAPEIDELVPQLAVMTDTTDEMIKEVRRQIKYGADWIKIYATGTLRHIDRETMDPLPQLSEEQVRAIVEEAGRFRKDVAAHAYGGDGARASVLGGVRSIEHGMLLDESILSLMADRGTFWCPTLSVFAPRTPEEEADAFFKRIQVRQRRAFQKGMELGVKIVFGTDAGAIRHGDNAVEFLHMVRLGMEPMVAIKAATSLAAELLRLEDTIGAIKPGLQADLIAVRSDPLADIRALQDVAFVMKGGKIVKSPLTN